LPNQQDSYARERDEDYTKGPRCRDIWGQIQVLGEAAWVQMMPFPGWGLRSIKIGSEEIVKELKVKVYCSCRKQQDRRKRWLSALVMTGFTRTVRSLWMLYLGREHLSPVVLVKSNITSFFTQECCDIIVQAKDIAQS